MPNPGDLFTLLALEGQAAEHGEVGVTYAVLTSRGGKYWMDRPDGGRGIAAVPAAQLDDPAIWSPI